MRTHQREQVKDVIVVRSHYIERHTTELHEVLKALGRPFAAVYHVHHIVCQHKRRPVSVDYIFSINM